MLSTPQTKFPDWSRFLSAVGRHGMSVNNIDKDKLNYHLQRAYPNILEAFTQRSESSVIRPSAFLACARQAYIKNVERVAPEPMPDNIGATFAIGHLLHEISYAAMNSAMPEGFQVHTELPVALPEWWPKNKLMFNQDGHVDMFVEITDEDKAGEFLPLNVVEEQPKMLVDFKTMGGYSYKKHSKTDYSTAVDGFGYLSQLAVYADALGVIGNGAILAGINRDSLTMPLMPRYISPSILMRELERVKHAFDYAEKGVDPKAEFLIRHGSEANFYCGRGGRPGYCPFKKHCKKLDDKA